MTKEEQDRKILENIQAGERTEDVAVDFGLTQAGVFHICQRAGLNLARHRAKARRERNRRIVERIQSGQVVSLVAKKFGINRDYVTQICRSAGLKVNEIQKIHRRQGRDRKIVVRVQEGVSLEIVGREFGLSSERVRQICLEAGLNLKEERRARNRQIIERIQTGKSQVAVAKEFRLTPNTISKICREAGVNVKSLRQHETQERNTEIVRRVKAGETRAAVARDFILHVNGVSWICREAGAVAWKRLSKQEYQVRNAEIVRRVASGETQVAVAKDFGLTATRVGAICTAAGFQGSPESSPPRNP